MRRLFPLLLLLLASTSFEPLAQTPREREVAARFAPVVRQSLGDRPRSDLITNFDFDGDWRGDNNWASADARKSPARAYVYYSVAETRTHLLIHYAFFHPQDYKGGGRGGAILSELIKEGARRGGKYDPTGLSSEVVLAHENDMEGCLVVARKGRGDDPAGASVVLVETLAHDRFITYAPEGGLVRGARTLRLEDGRPALYVEPKGHGVWAYDGGDEQRSKTGTLTYRFAARAEDPGERTEGEVGYDLLSLHTTLWPRASRAPNETYGAAADFGTVVISVPGKGGKDAERKVALGRRGAAFAGRVGAPNAARPPWGWFDREDRAAEGWRAGAWFFDPAGDLKRRHRLGADFSSTYTFAPFLGVGGK